MWLHNSVRGAVALGLAVLVAELDGRAALVLGRARHAVGAALERAEHRARTSRAGCSAPPSGFVVGAALLALIGTDTTLLWVLLPVAILFAGVAPAAISFAAGQAAFTLTLVILFNIIAAGRLAGRAAARRGRRDRLRA